VCEDDGDECTNDACNPETGTCDYPPVQDGTPCTDGICLNGVCEDPCDPNPCGLGATCRAIGIAEHVCECDTVEFSNEGGICDSINPSVCIARDYTMGLYNRVDEPGYNRVAECVSPSPTLTEWASLPCAQATDVDFGTWVSSTFMELPYCTPPQMVGVPACVRLTDGSNQEWDIRMTDWCVAEEGGCFSYVRSHNVDDGQACEAPLCEGVVCEDDGDECTRDVCNAATGTCDYPPVQDGTPCTGGICLSGVCEVLCVANVCQCSEFGIRAIDIDNNVILDGEGNLRVDGNDTHRVFSMATGITAELRGMAITGGQGDDGGGIANSGTLTLTNSTVSGNSAGFAGGGMASDGMLTLTNSTVSGNSAGFAGGGIANSGTLTLTNSTVSGNSALEFGGGIAGDGPLTLTNCTLSENDAGMGSAIFMLADIATVRNTLVDGDCAGATTTSLGYNIESPNDTCGFDPEGTDLVSVPGPVLGPLQDNGGPTMTHEPGSVAINRIPLEDCVVSTDQRGQPRPETGGSMCDVGSVEVQDGTGGAGGGA
jgi:predicted outer membrane repeat protein